MCVFSDQNWFLTEDEEKSFRFFLSENSKREFVRTIQISSSYNIFLTKIFNLNLKVFGMIVLSDCDFCSVILISNLKKVFCLIAYEEFLVYLSILSADKVSINFESPGFVFIQPSTIHYRITAQVSGLCYKKTARS